MPTIYTPSVGFRLQSVFLGMLAAIMVGNKADIEVTSSARERHHRRPRGARWLLFSSCCGLRRWVWVCASHMQRAESHPILCVCCLCSHCKVHRLDVTFKNILHWETHQQPRLVARDLVRRWRGQRDAGFGNPSASSLF